MLWNFVVLNDNPNFIWIFSDSQGNSAEICTGLSQCAIMMELTIRTYLLNRSRGKPKQSTINCLHMTLFVVCATIWCLNIIFLIIYYHRIHGVDKLDTDTFLDDEYADKIYFTN